jgi:predicted Zn-dependent peptidase
MKKYSLAIITLALAATASAQKLDRSVRPKPGPAPKIELGKTESFTLPNGLRVFVVENHKVPVVSVSLQLNVKPELQGSMAGFHDIVGELITSGTKTRSKDKLDLDIDNIGAAVKADEESMFGTCLKRNQNALLEIMSDIIMHPAFKQTELDKLKKQSLSGLAAAKNNPDAMLANVTRAINYGSGHPYGEVATETTVKAATLDRCVKYFNTYWRPNVAYMAIVGDVTSDEIKPLIGKYFGGWAKANVPVATYTVPKPGGVTHVAFAGRDAAVQSVFNVTYPINLQPGTPDVIKARVMNAVLGGGSQGRLFLNLREAHGWTYGSYSSIKEDDLIGNFTAYAKCRNAVTDSAIQQTLAEMQRLQSEPISQEDLQSRITNITGQFAINLENPQTVAQYAINIERYHMPKDYYTNYLQNLAAVTPADVQEMAKKYIHPEAANIVVVGSTDEVAKKLEQFGKVDFFDNYGKPAAVVAKANAPVGLTVEAVRKKYINALGGEQVISGLKDMKLVYSFEPQPGVTVTMTELKNGTSMKREISAMGQTFQKSVYSNGKGTQEAQGQSKDMDASDLADAAHQADLQAALHPEKYGIKYTLNGIEKLDGQDAYVLETVDADGDKGKEYYSVADGFLIKSIHHKMTPQGDMAISTEYKDYREVPGTGYRVPNMLKQNIGPQSFDAKLEKVEINKGIPDSEFK